MNMFSSAEFVGEWNQIFSFKIKESDLTKPTESFVFNALVNYLKMFNFDTAPMIQMKNSENYTERRNFLIRFCNYIDHIYKISDKNHSFVYYDLLHPAPKKTVHMLNHLLNYYFYFTMFKDSIVPVAYGKIRQREELIDKINKFKYENEQIEIKNKMIEKAIVDYRALVPKTSAELSKLIDIEAKERDEINALEEKLNNCNIALEALRNQEVLLTMEIVSQEEVDQLLRSKATLTNAIAEQEGYESNSYANHQERSATVAKLQNIMTSIDEAIDLNPPATLALHKQCKVKFKELETTLAEMKRKKENLKQVHEKLQGDLKRIEKEMAVKCRMLKEIKIAGEKEIEEIKQLTESSQATMAELEGELHATEQQLCEQRDVSNYILENAALMVKAAMDYCIEPKERDYL